ncbi:VOC family protein [Bradyrhizobium sp. Ce-3]|uniref:VOC family protein n=1 Tax=Bradyrhizobium sp. Ce-3 TaxID=2913970 RepID=UPI001FC828AE|nr:VOC family protein [Bradyrhizobium sp. Ce-3]GKQ52368.1 lactoylglutathione lyase [Bradyrhizobium sp. Ce-3]
MSNAPTARFTVLTLGVSDMRASIAFYQSLGFARKMRATGEEVAFFETGGTVLGLFPWHLLADDAGLPDQPRPAAFHGVSIAWNCNDDAEVDRVMAFALSKGAKLLKPAQPTSYGGYCGYFGDPDGHAWEVVRAPGFEVLESGLVSIPD